MTFVLQSRQRVLATLASWINQQQQQVVEYLCAENLMVKEKLGKKRILLNDHQRRRLAINGQGARSHDARRGRHALHAGYDSALVPATHRQEVGPYVVTPAMEGL